MGAGDRTNREQDRDEGRSGHCRVDQELDPGVPRAEPIPSDPRTDDGGEEQGGSGELGEDAAADPRARIVRGHPSGHAH